MLHSVSKKSLAPATPKKRGRPPEATPLKPKAALTPKTTTQCSDPVVNELIKRSMSTYMQKKGQKRASSPATLPTNVQQAPKVQKAAPPVVDKSSDTEAARFERASLALRPGMPKGSPLPCREAERSRITNHLRNGVQQGGSTRVMYISGMPGTGKTASVMEVLEQLRAESCNFHLVSVNAMKLATPQQIFREVAEQLLNKRVSNCDAYYQINEHFCNQKAGDPVVVLLIDEVDCLTTANQAVLYKVFDWLQLPGARLVLAAIANTMDLPERLLPRVQSRFFDIERVDFAPYNRKQLYEILDTRLKGYDAREAFSDTVLSLCAAKVASGSGDVRKALQICRRAVDKCVEAPNREPGPVKVPDYESAQQELLFANPVTTAVLKLNATARRFLAAVVYEMQQQEDAEAVLLHKVSSRLHKLLTMISVDSERGAVDTGAATGEGVFAAWEVEDMCLELVPRLEAMTILAKRTGKALPLVEFQFQAVTLGALDAEEIAAALLKVEDDDTVRDFLERGNPQLCPEKGRSLN